MIDKENNKIGIYVAAPEISPCELETLNKIVDAIVRNSEVLYEVTSVFKSQRGSEPLSIQHTNINVE